MSDDRIDPFWEFYYETGIDPTGGELDTGEEEYYEVIEDEEEFVEECCCRKLSERNSSRNSIRARTRGKTKGFPMPSGGRLCNHSLPTM